MHSFLHREKNDRKYKIQRSSSVTGIESVKNPIGATRDVIVHIPLAIHPDHGDLTLPLKNVPLG